MPIYRQVPSRPQGARTRQTATISEYRSRWLLVPATIAPRGGLPEYLKINRFVGAARVNDDLFDDLADNRL